MKKINILAITLSITVLVGCSDSSEDIFMSNCVNKSNSFNKQECYCAFNLLKKELPEDKLANFMASEIDPQKTMDEEQRHYMEYTAKALYYCSKNRR